ncbi:MAG: DUF4168 domain-containing protein [Bacteroidales bacterium]
MKHLKNLFSLVVATTLILSAIGLEAQVSEGDQQQDVSDEELETFVQVLNETQEYERNAQEEITQAIEENPDIDLQRYQEIMQAQQQGQEADMTEKEQEAFSEIQEFAQSKQVELDKKRGEILQDYGMDEQRYTEINQAVQTDQELMQKVQQMMREKQEPRR